MSKISLKHSGGNVVSLNSPTSAPTSADVAFKLPNADGTSGQVLKTDGSGNLSFGADTGGKILQVVQTVKVDQASYETTSFVDIAGMTATITPSSSSNKILVQTSIYLGAAGGRTSIINFVRGSTNIAQPTGSSATTKGTMMSFISGTQMNPFTMVFLDSPSTTSATTYKLQISQDNTGVPVYINRYHGSDNYHGISTLTLMEVAA